MTDVKQNPVYTNEELTEIICSLIEQNLNMSEVLQKMTIVIENVEEKITKTLSIAETISNVNKH